MIGVEITLDGKQPVKASALKSFARNIDDGESG